jgi:hypothetical protein
MALIWGAITKTFRDFLSQIQDGGKFCRKQLLEKRNILTVSTIQLLPPDTTNKIITTMIMGD